MRREGTDPDHVHMPDVLCDFCAQEWTTDRPMIEGHLGSCICGSCLAEAYRSVEIAGVDDRAAQVPRTCTMCREARDEPCREGAARPEAVICRRCITMAAKALSRDAESGWKLPVA